MNIKAFFILSLLAAFLTSCTSNKIESDIYILGTIHSNHLVSDLGYTLKDLENTLEQIKPDLICIEMTEEALGGEMEGYFPTENAVILEYAKRNNIPVCPVDWRADLSRQEKQIQPSDEDKKQLDKTQRAVEELVLEHLIKNNWEHYFAYVQDDSNFHAAIKKQHDLKIHLLGEESDGYWLTRNDSITENLVNAIQEHKPKVVLLTAGMHHTYIIKDQLKTKHKVKTLEVPAYAASENQAMPEEVIERWSKNLNALQSVLENDSASVNLKKRIEQSQRIRELKQMIDSKGVANVQIRHLFEK